MAEPRPTEKLTGSDALPYFYGKKWVFFREGLQKGLRRGVTFLAREGLQKGLHFPIFRGGI